MRQLALTVLVVAFGAGCNGDPAPPTDVEAYGTLRARHSGKCMTVEGASKADGARVVQRECDGSDEQLFGVGDSSTPVEPKGGFAGVRIDLSGRLIAKHSWKCLDFTKKAVEQRTCNGSAEQDHDIADIESDPELGDCLVLVAKQTRECLGVADGSSEDGAPVERSECTAPPPAWCVPSEDESDEQAAAADPACAERWQRAQSILDMHREASPEALAVSAPGAGPEPAARPSGRGVLRGVAPGLAAHRGSSATPERRIAPPPVQTRGLGDSGVQVFRDNVARVFLLETPDGGEGSGVLLGRSGWIVTNFHVVAGHETVYVYGRPAGGGTLDAQEPRQASVIAADPGRDLALLEVAGLDGTSPAKLRGQEEVEVGSPVYAIGHPLGLYWSFTQGIVSQVRRSFEWETDQILHRADVIQTQTPINPGNSGGPLFDSEGRVLGVNAFVFEASDGLNFAIGSDEIARFLDERPAPPDYATPIAERDLDRDGRIDAWAFDRSGNGQVDYWNHDLDGDGLRESFAWEEWQDGILDAVGFDEDADDFAEFVYVDEDADGLVDGRYTTDADGAVYLAAGCDDPEPIASY